LPLARALLRRLDDVRGLGVTGAAPFCQQALSRSVVQQGGPSFWARKDTQPDLLDDVRPLFADPPFGETFPTAVAHGRHGDCHERRTLQASALLSEAGALRWPHAGQVCAIRREVTRNAKTTVEWGYAVTSLTPAQPNARRLLELWRGHGGSENNLHWGRDVTFDEDRCQVRTGAGPQVMAALRSTAIGVLRRAGHPNIAAALRTYAGRPHAALALLGLTPPAPRL
jgi:predicted transposase YbfD/YdcC